MSEYYEVHVLSQNIIFESIFQYLGKVNLNVSRVGFLFIFLEKIYSYVHIVKEQRTCKKRVIKCPQTARVNIICSKKKVFLFSHRPKLTHVNGIQLRVVHDRDLLSLKVW